MSEGSTQTSHLKRVAYLALGVRDLHRASQFYHEVLGLGETERDDDGRLYLRCNAYHHALVLIPGGVGIDHYGLDVGEETDLQNAAVQLESVGVEYREVKVLAGQGRALELVDPAGIVVRLVTGTQSVDPEYGAPVVQPRKLSHLNLLCRDLEEQQRFYLEALDFRVSDVVEGVGVWMRCNTDHHGIAYARSSRGGIQHLAFEARAAIDLLRQADHLAAHGHRLVWGPGRHGPGNNLFIYFFDPEGNLVELTAEMEQIWTDENRPPAWNPADDPHWANRWGQPATAEFLANALTPEELEELRARDS